MEDKEVLIHRIMCTSGGFMAGYAIFGRIGNFGSAQTVNMVEIVINIIGRNFSDVVIRLVALLLYAGGMLVGSLIKKRFGEIKLRIYTVSMLIVGYLGLSLMPENMNLFVSVLPIFFMASGQWFTFSGTKKYNCSTIFSSNNFKQATVGYINYLLYKKDNYRLKGRFYLISIVFYHIGVTIAVLLCIEFGIKASIFGTLIVFPVINITRKSVFMEKMIPDKKEV